MSMENEAELIRDPKFRQLLSQRSRWRWGFSGGLIGIYFVYCLAGIYFSEVFSRPALGTSISWSIALGYLVIALAIVLSMLYIRIVGKMFEKPIGGGDANQ